MDDLNKENIAILTKDIYYKLIEVYGKDKIDNYLDDKIEKELLECKTKEKRIEIWDKYSYYLSTKEHSIYEKNLIISLEKKYLTEEEQIIYGLHLLIKDNLEITTNNVIDLNKVFSKLKTKKNIKYVLKILIEFYNTKTTTSSIDNLLRKTLNEYLKEYQNIKEDSTKNINIEELYIIHQVEMYIRYNKAKEKYINSNIKLVEFALNNTFKKEERTEDLYQDGIVGLINAINTFDIRKGNAFSTYAVTVIKNHLILESLKYTYGIRLSQNLNQQKRKFDKVRTTLINELTRIPTNKEIADYLNIPLEKYEEISSLIYKLQCESTNRIIKKNPDYEYEIEETIMDKDNYVDKIIYDELINIIFNKIDETLTSKEKDVLFKRVGYNEKEEIPMTLCEIGHQLGKTQEAIRQIESKALTKLRRNRWIKNANPFIN